jgi:ankyrin repeat protein
VTATPDPPDLNAAFLQAAARGSLPALERLLAQGADVNACTVTGRTALMSVGSRGERTPAVARLLLDRGADITPTDRMGLTALHHAVQRAGPKTVELLLRKRLQRREEVKIPERRQAAALQNGAASNLGGLTALKRLTTSLMDTWSPSDRCVSKG